MPEIFLLRKKGYSFSQIVELLVDCCGLTIQPSTARAYFYEMLHEKESERLKRLDEFEALLPALEKLVKQTQDASLKDDWHQAIQPAKSGSS